MFRLFLLLALLAMPAHRALALERPPDGSELQLFIENDLLAQDRPLLHQWHQIRRWHGL
jgi:hypothetical protein